MLISLTEVVKQDREKVSGLIGSAELSHDMIYFVQYDSIISRPASSATDETVHIILSVLLKADRFGGPFKQWHWSGMVNLDMSV